MVLAPAPQRLTERERQRLRSTRELLLTSQCANGWDHLACGGTVALGISCGCVCHAMATHARSSIA